MSIENLNESNFPLYAAKYYDNPHCFDMKEFNEDLNRFRYVKRLFTKYKETGELKERLILNHIIILYNLFGAEPTTRMLFYKMEGFHEYLKPFLLLLNYLPQRNHRPQRVDSMVVDNIVMDPLIVERLRKI